MDSDDDLADFQIEHLHKRTMKKSSSHVDNGSGMRSEYLQTDEKCAEMNAVLVDMLPEKFEYKVTKFKILKMSDIPNESQFNMECRANIKTMDEWKE